MKKVFLSTVIAASILFYGCGSSEEKKHEEVMPAADTSQGVSAMAHDSTHGELAYVCPCGGCPEVKEAKPGKCPKCEMELVEQKK